jgi:hypothetical protein
MRKARIIWEISTPNIPAVFVAEDLTMPPTIKPKPSVPYPFEEGHYSISSGGSYESAGGKFGA